MTTALCGLAVKYGTGKCSIHHYTPVYDAAFIDRRYEIRNVLEIGIHEGASLRMWAEYFPNANVFGIDKRSSTMLFGQPRIRTFVGNQFLPDTLIAVAKGKTFDLIVDDGSHKPKDQISAALTLLPYLDKHGSYVIEDVHRYPKQTDGIEDPGGIMRAIPKGYASKLIRTGEGHDDVMIWITGGE